MTDGPSRTLLFADCAVPTTLYAKLNLHRAPLYVAASLLKLGEQDATFCHGIFSLWPSLQYLTHTPKRACRNLPWCAAMKSEAAAAWRKEELTTSRCLNL